MAKLQFVADDANSRDRSSKMQSYWLNSLLDPTMLDVSLYFARLVYATRAQQRARQLAVEVYQGKALRSVMKRVQKPSTLSDGLIAAVLVLTILNVRRVRRLHPSRPF